MNMPNYFVILQENSLETRQVYPLDCQPSELMIEVNKICGDKQHSTIADATEALLEVDFNLTVIDTKTSKIVE